MDLEPILETVAARHENVPQMGHWSIPGHHAHVDLKIQLHLWAIYCNQSTYLIGFGQWEETGEPKGNPCILYTGTTFQTLQRL